MTNCIRPDCENELHTGKSYCSTTCAALDRKRLKSTTRLEMPIPISEAIVGQLGESGKIIINEVNTFLAENSKELAVIPFPSEGITYGDWVLSFDGDKEYRPGTALDYDTIEMMLRSGPVVFSMEMKRAQVFKVFSEGRFKVESPDKELAEVANAALKFIMPKMAMDFTWSAFAYGVSFQEEIWENKTKYELGMATSANAKSPFTVPKVPNSVKPTTVPHIRRTLTGNHFNGFVQDKPGSSTLSGIDGIIVDRDAALVIPLNERFRNLWGESFLKPLYPIWLWYEITLRTMARYMERMAMPVTVAKAPSRSSVLIEGQTRPVRAMDLALALAGNVSKSNAVAIPSDRDEMGNPLWELSYLTADEKGQAFIQVLEFLQQEMIRAGLSADRSLSQSSGGVGSYNIGELHAQASSLTSEMILQQFVFYLNLYFMPSFSLYNRGRNGPPIWLKTQAIDLAERELLMSLIGVAGNAPAGQEFFWMIDWEMLGGISNIPMLTPEQIDERKKKIQDEQMDKMEQQQKIMAANAAPIAKGGASAFPEKDKAKTPEPTPVAAKGNGKLEDDGYEYVVESLLDGRRIPWILSEEEVAILLAGRGVDEETIKLFNPFHAKDSGRFAKGRGGSGGGLGAPGVPTGAGDVAVKEAVLNKAMGKKGFPFKTTGAILGLGGLGLVGVAIVQASPEKSFDEYREENLEKKATEAEQLQAELQELTKDWPKNVTPEQAMGLAIDNLKEVGIEGIPDDIKVNVGSTPMGMGAYYDPETNTFTMNPQIAAELASGDPFALAAVFHEVAHSNQELQGENFTVGLDEFPENAPFNNPDYRALIEGQNDLVAHMALSNQYGQPMSNETVVDQHNQAQSLNSSVLTLETGVTITSSGGLEINSYGYQDDAAVYAAIASEGGKLTGQTSKEYLISNHNEGFNLQRQHQNLVDLFPEEMKSGNFYQEVEETEGGLFGIGGTTKIVKKRQFPSTSEIRTWMKQHGYIDPKKAYDQMLEEAANG